MSFVRHFFGYVFGFLGFVLGTLGKSCIIIAAWCLDHEDLLEEDNVSD